MVKKKKRKNIFRWFVQKILSPIEIDLSYLKDFNLHFGNEQVVWWNADTKVQAENVDNSYTLQIFWLFVPSRRGWELFERPS